MSEQEIKSHLMVATKMPVVKGTPIATAGAFPAAFDARTEWPACMGVIRDQQQCGSCWAFSAVGDFGDRACVAGVDKKRIQYSEEYVVSCDPKDKGCQGGSVLYVHMFLKNTGTTTLACNAYKSGNGTTGTCPTKCDDGSAIKLTKSPNYRIMELSIDAFMLEISVHGPIQGMFYVYEDFEYYESGIYQHEYGEMLGGHGIMIVGWGEENGTPYWICRNSWGEDWGEAGHFRIIRGTNECIIETAAAAASFNWKNHLSFDYLHNIL